MYPELFKIGPFTVYSYGLMLGLAFIISSYILTKEFERRKFNPNLATEITLIAIIFGVIGSKMAHLIESWDRFVLDPVGMIFNPGGLTYYGGFILATIAIGVYLRKKKVSFFAVGDAMAPSLALAYGIGRIGCHLAGDGDYGLPTSLPWGTNYENGTVLPSIAFRGSEIAQQFPGGVVPDNTPLHPTPVYEFLIMLGVFFVLRKFRNKDWADGKLFMLYLIFAGAERLSIEFIRLNPRLLFGLSEAQLISVVMIIAGSAGLYYFGKHPLPKYIPPPLKAEAKKK